MCYHSSHAYTLTELDEYYGLTNEHSFDDWQRFYHCNAFDHHLLPAFCVDTDSLSQLSWGLIPWYTKSIDDAMKIRNQTLNCVSEEMYDKPSFRDAVNEGKRCLIPFTGFFEWKWLDPAGKEKTPYYIYLKSQKIFSVAGLYSSWHEKQTDTYYHTFSVLTTRANKLMSEIHNSKKRMPVIIHRDAEKEWLSANLSKSRVMELCQPFEDSLMDAYTISKRITSRKDPTNVPEVLQPFTYEKTTLF